MYCFGFIGSGGKVLRECVPTILSTPNIKSGTLTVDAHWLAALNGRNTGINERRPFVMGNAL